jgi:hypothetical protein
MWLIIRTKKLAESKYLCTINGMGTFSFEPHRLTTKSLILHMIDCWIHHNEAPSYILSSHYQYTRVQWVVGPIKLWKLPLFASWQSVGHRMEGDHAQAPPLWIFPANGCKIARPRDHNPRKHSRTIVKRHHASKVMAMACQHTKWQKQEDEWQWSSPPAGMHLNALQNTNIMSWSKGECRVTQERMLYCF